MRISDWSSDVCSSDLLLRRELEGNEARTLAVVGGRRDEAGAGPTGQPALWQRHQVLDPRAGAAVLGEVDPARHAGAELAGIEGGLQWIGTGHGSPHRRPGAERHRLRLVLQSVGRAGAPQARAKPRLKLLLAAVGLGDRNRQLARPQA